MSFIELFLLAFSLSMDAFAVSICKGLAIEKESKTKACLKCGLWFGFFQALMPLIGYYLGKAFESSIQKFDHWIAFVLLFAIGINMIRESLSKKEENEHNDDFSIKTMFILAIATSIDALAVGISLAMAGSVNIWIAISLIGIFTCLFCIIGVKLGNVFGSFLGNKAQMIGGIILDHLGILG